MTEQKKEDAGGASLSDVGLESLCPFCGGAPRMADVLRDGFARGEPDSIAYFLRCNSCAACGPWAKNIVGAMRMWKMRSNVQIEARRAFAPSLSNAGLDTIVESNCQNRTGAAR